MLGRGYMVGKGEGVKQQTPSCERKCLSHHDGRILSYFFFFTFLNASQF